MLRTIAIIGPESTGKTELCEKLAKQLQCAWVPEYARTYVEQLQRPYTYDDVVRIAEEQTAELKAMQRKHAADDLLLLDTELIITKVWFEYVYKRMPDWIDGAIKQQHIDLYLLCRPDIAWEYDKVRENGGNRDFLYDWYKREIELTHTPYVEIDGLGDVRTQNALKAIANLINQDNKK